MNTTLYIHENRNNCRKQKPWFIHKPTPTHIFPPFLSSNLWNSLHHLHLQGSFPQVVSGSRLHNLTLDRCAAFIKIYNAKRQRRWVTGVFRAGWDWWSVVAELLLRCKLSLFSTHTDASRAELRPGNVYRLGVLWWPLMYILSGMFVLLVKSFSAQLTHTQPDKHTHVHSPFFPHLLVFNSWRTKEKKQTSISIELSDVCLLIYTDLCTIVCCAGLHFQLYGHTLSPVISRRKLRTCLI